MYKNLFFLIFLNYHTHCPNYFLSILLLLCSCLILCLSLVFPSPSIPYLSWPILQYQPGNAAFEFNSSQKSAFLFSLHIFNHNFHPSITHWCPTIPYIFQPQKVFRNLFYGHLELPTIGSSTRVDLVNGAFDIGIISLSMIYMHEDILSI